MREAVNTFLVVIAAIFPVVNPPGSAIVFLALTSEATPDVRRAIALRVAVNSFMVLVCSFLLGALILRFYGISIPILRVSGGLIVAVSGWKLLNEGSTKKESSARDMSSAEHLHSYAFYPLTLPLTTGPGTIAVTISIGLSSATFTSPAGEFVFIIASLAAITLIAISIWFCFANADRMQRFLGEGGTDIAVRLSAFILFCLGVEIFWSGMKELLLDLMHKEGTAAYALLA